MPRIAEIREIEGEIWVRADIRKIENGSAWWSPNEQKAKYQEGFRDGYQHRDDEIKGTLP